MEEYNRNATVGDVVILNNSKYVITRLVNHENQWSCGYDREYFLTSLDKMNKLILDGKTLIIDEDYKALSSREIHVGTSSWEGFIVDKSEAPFEIRVESYNSIRRKEKVIKEEYI